MAFDDQMIEHALTKRAPEEAGRLVGSPRRASEKLAAVWAEIQRLGLESHIAEFDAVG